MNITFPQMTFTFRFSARLVVWRLVTMNFPIHSQSRVISVEIFCVRLCVSYI